MDITTISAVAFLIIWIYYASSSIESNIKEVKKHLEDTQFKVSRIDNTVMRIEDKLDKGDTE